MKRNTQKNPKLKRLARELQINRAHAIGILELLWQYTAQNTPGGNIGRCDDEDIAEECFWDGEPATLVKALVDCGWLDPCKYHRLVVHDWYDHAGTTARRTQDAVTHGICVCLCGSRAMPRVRRAVGRVEKCLPRACDEFLTLVPRTKNHEPRTENPPHTSQKHVSESPEGDDANSEPADPFELDGVAFPLKFLERIWAMWPEAIKASSEFADVARWVDAKRRKLIALDTPREKIRQKLVYWTGDAIDAKRLGAEIDYAATEWSSRPRGSPGGNARASPNNAGPELTDSDMADLYEDGEDSGDTD